MTSSFSTINGRIRLLIIILLTAFAVQAALDIGFFFEMRSLRQNESGIARQYNGVIELQRLFSSFKLAEEEMLRSSGSYAYEVYTSRRNDLQRWFNVELPTSSSLVTDRDSVSVFIAQCDSLYSLHQHLQENRNHVDALGRRIFNLAEHPLPVIGPLETLHYSHENYFKHPTREGSAALRSSAQAVPFKHPLLDDYITRVNSLNQLEDALARDQRRMYRQADTLESHIGKSRLALRGNMDYFFYAAQQRLTAVVLWNLILVLVAYLVIVLLLVSIMHRLGAPISSLLGLVDKVKKHDFSVRFTYNNHDEICLLGQAMNDMLAEVERERDDLEQKIKIRTLQLEKARCAAEDANLAKSQFLTNMSHELRTPLNGINTVAELLFDTALNQEQRDLVEILRSSGDTLLELVNDVFDFSRIESGQVMLARQAFSLRHILEGVLAQCSIKAHEKRLELVSAIPSDVPDNLLGDAPKLQQILLNLLGNAVKFTNNGEIIFRVKVLEQNPELIKLYFTISDTGIGIAPDMLEKIFESFTQGDNSRTRAYGGSGLGTTIARELIQLMNGGVGVESPNPELKDMEGEHDPGSLFWFTAEFAPATEHVGEDLSFTNLEITSLPVLVVDDNENQARSLTAMISQFGFSCRYVCSGMDALQILRREAEEQRFVKILLVDVAMGDMSGYELVEYVQHEELCPGAHIVFLSTTDSPQEHKMAQTLGISTFLTKPVPQSRLYNAFAGFLQQPEELQVAPVNQRLQGSVLLAEDNLINQKVAIKVFNSLGLDPEVAANGSEVLEKLTRNRYDIIFMDVEMPVMNGIDATIELRNRGLRLPVVAMTANAMKGDRELCLAAGMDDYIAKPIRRERLKGVLEQWLSVQTEEPAPAKATDQIPAQEVINIKAGIELVGDQDTFFDLVSEFMEYSRELLQVLDESVKTAENYKIILNAHSLKGSAANLGMTPLREAALALETAARNEETTQYGDLLQTVHARFIEVDNYFEQVKKQG